MNTEATVKLVLDPKSSDNVRYLKIQVTFNRQTRVYAVGCKMKLSKEQFLNDRLKETKIAKNEAATFQNIALEIVRELGQDFSFTRFHKSYKERAFSGIGQQVKTDIKSVYDLYFASDPNLTLSTIQSYKTGLQWILKFKPTTHIEDISVEYIGKLEKFIKQEHQKAYYAKYGIKHDISIASIGMYFRGLRAVLNFAKDKQLLSTDLPFGQGQGHYVIRTKARTKKALSQEELTAFIKYRTDDPVLQLSWDFFLLSMLCSGMNMGDILALKNKNIVDGHIEFVRIKTRNTQMTEKAIRFLIPDKAYEIIKKYGVIDELSPEAYIFPIYEGAVTKEQFLYRKKCYLKKINKGLKHIFQDMGLNHYYTTYNARHTFSTFLVNAGFSVEQISMLLGHSDIKVTQNYLDSLSRQNVEAVKTAMDELVGKF